MSDTYGSEAPIVPTPVKTIPFSRPNDPDVDLSGNVPRITIRPKGGEKVDPFADFPSAPPKGKGLEAGSSNYSFDDFPDKPTEPKEPSRVVGGEESVFRGLAHGATFGAAPAIAGLAEASGMPSAATEPGTIDVNPIRPIVGAAKMLHGWVTDHPDPQVKAAYEKGRQAALADQKLSEEQHPHAYLAGQLAGALAIPMPGMGAGTALARVGKGAVGGGVGGGLYGAGTAISEGKDAGEVASSAATNAAIGAPIGGVLGGVLGPRLVNPNSPGQMATRTAESLGAPLPRGLASDSPTINATTAKIRSIPVVGSRVSSAVDKIQEAAGHNVENISSAMAGGGTNRAIADTVARPGLQSVIDANRATIDAAYKGVRSRINQTQKYTLPRTQAAIDAIKASRTAAGHVEPGKGLEQFENVARGATFDGAHRARVDAREAGNGLVPHPGYNAADYNKLTRALTADIRDVVATAASGSSAAKSAAVRAFDEAEKEFGRLAEQNGILHRLVNAKGEAAISTLLGAAREKGGNLKLLAQLRNSMPARDFEVIGGTLLDELGHSNATNSFSLAKFVTEWGKLSDGAKRVMFSPSHLKNIEDIVQLGTHIKGALKESNTSHTAGVLVMLDLARDAALLGVAAASGAVGASTGVGLAFGGAGVLFAHWLSSPAKAAAMSAWSKAYRGVATGTVTPIRQAAFMGATRNLAHNLGVPANDILRAVQQRLPLAAQTPDNAAEQ